MGGKGGLKKEGWEQGGGQKDGEMVFSSCFLLLSVFHTEFLSPFCLFVGPVECCFADYLSLVSLSFFHRAKVVLGEWEK